MPGARRQLARRRPVLQLAQPPGGTTGLLSAGQRRIGRRGLAMRSVVRRLSFAHRSGMGVRLPRGNRDAVLQWRRSGRARCVRLAGHELQIAHVACGRGSCPMPGACLTCTAAYGNGVTTGRGGLLRAVVGSVENGRRRAVDDPCGPKTATRRVYRGGSWADGAGSCRSAFRTRASRLTASTTWAFAWPQFRSVRSERSQPGSGAWSGGRRGIVRSGAEPSPLRAGAEGGAGGGRDRASEAAQPPWGPGRSPGAVDAPGSPGGASRWTDRKPTVRGRRRLSHIRSIEKEWGRKIIGRKF